MEKANIANETSNEFKKFTLKNVEDFLSDNEMKNTRGGSTGGNCWKYNCLLGEPCSDDPTDPCPGDILGTCYESSSVCFNDLDSNCTYGFLMWPCP